MNRRRQLLDDAAAKLRQAMDEADGVDRLLLIEQAVDLHRRALAEAAEPAGSQANDDDVDEDRSRAG